MYRYLFMFRSAMGDLVDWDCWAPEEPVSDAMAVQQAFNCLILNDDFECVDIYQDGKHFMSSSGRLLVARVSKLVDG